MNVRRKSQSKRRAAERRRRLRAERLEKRLLLTTFDLANLGPSDGLRIFGEASNFSDAGVAVSDAGDVNGDGYDDLLVGSYSANSEGDAYIIYGGPRYRRRCP